MMYLPLTTCAFAFIHSFKENLYQVALFSERKKIL